MSQKYTKTNSSFSKFKSKKGGVRSFYEEEEVSIKDIKRDKQHKHYRNYENALRSKNVDRLLSYDDE
jgi:hypothetical protein